MLLEPCKHFGRSIELQILPKLDQSKLPHQLPLNYKTLNPPSHHQNPDTPLITKPLKISIQFEKCKHMEQCKTRGTMRGVWVDFFDGLHQLHNPSYKGEKCDNKERDLN